MRTNVVIEDGLMRKAMRASGLTTKRAVVEVGLREAGSRLHLTVTDDGVGAFAHLQAHAGLTTPLDGLLEISKGKATSDPAHHTGEGLFFTSKAVSRSTNTATSC